MLVWISRRSSQANIKGERPEDVLEKIFSGRSWNAVVNEPWHWALRQTSNIAPLVLSLGESRVGNDWSLFSCRLFIVHFHPPLVDGNEREFSFYFTAVSWIESLLKWIFFSGHIAKKFSCYEWRCGIEKDSKIDPGQSNEKSSPGMYTTKTFQTSPPGYVVYWEFPLCKVLSDTILK